MGEKQQKSLEQRLKEVAEELARKTTDTLVLIVEEEQRGGFDFKSSMTYQLIYACMGDEKKPILDGSKYGIGQIKNLQLSPDRKRFLFQAAKDPSFQCNSHYNHLDCLCALNVDGKFFAIISDTLEAMDPDVYQLPKEEFDVSYEAQAWISGSIVEFTRIIFRKNSLSPKTMAYAEQFCLSNIIAAVPRKYDVYRAVLDETNSVVEMQHISSELPLAHERDPTLLHTKPEKRYSDLGGDYYRIGEFGKAIEYYTIAIVLAPTRPEPYFNRGLAYTRKGEYEKAIEDFKQTIKINPKEDDAYYSLAIIYSRCMNDANSALENLRTVLKLNPEHTQAKSLMELLKEK